MTADDVVLKASAGVASGVGSIAITSQTLDREMGIGLTIKPFHISDDELGRFVSSTGLSIGDSRNGDITVHGLRAINTNTPLALTATRGGKQVTFASTATNCAKGLTVRAAAGVILQQDVTSAGTSTFS